MLPAVFFGFSGAVAQAAVIENVSVTEGPGVSVVKITLSRRLAYRSHAPMERGDRIIVQLQPLDPDTDLATLTRQQDYAWRPTGEVPLTSVEYDRNPGGFALISLYFRNSVRYSVSAAADGTSLSVKIEHRSAPGGDSAASGSRSAAPAAAPGSRVDRFMVPVPPAAATSTLDAARTGKQMDELMGQGKTAIIQADYGLATQQYRQALELPRNKYTRKALEYLGLSLELDGRSADAEVVYQAFLQRYPEGEHSERVQQRLQSLQTATQVPREPLRKGREKQTPDVIKPVVSEIVPEESDYSADFYGSFSNFYNGFVLQTSEGAELVQSAIQADLFLSGMLKTRDWSFRANFTGGQLINTIGRRGSSSTTRINNGYLDMTHEGRGFNARLGRQVGYNGGVLGRFDGVRAGYRLNEMLRLNAVFGFPVEYTSVTRENNDNVFYGFNADILNIQAPMDTKLDFNVFFIQQFIDGLEDRLAIGGDVRLFSENLNLFSQIDYDVIYSTLNIATLNGNWRLPTQTSINFLLDYRKAPILTTSNALLGNVLAPNIDGLRSLLTTDQIRELARNNSVDSATFTLGFSHPFTEKYQLNADFTATNLSQTPDGVVRSPFNNNEDLIIEGIPGTGWEYFTSAQLMGNNLFSRGDFYALNFRYASLQTSNRYGISLNSRVPLMEDLDFSPRFRVDHRVGQQNVNDWTFAPSLQMRYRLFKGLQFEAEVGAEFITDNIADDIGSFTDGNYYFIVGYRVDFPDIR